MLVIVYLAEIHKSAFHKTVTKIFQKIMFEKLPTSLIK